MAMRYPPVDLNQLTVLPQTNQMTIPEDYLDEMGHMNIAYYVHLYNRAAWGMFEWLGISFKRMQTVDGGMFALEQHIRYLAEVHVGETVLIRSRVLGLSAKRLHFIHFMINQTTDKLASTFEVLASYANLKTRRTAAFPDEFVHDIRAKLVGHQALGWDAPMCGMLSP